MTSADAERFWSKVGTPTATGCVEWQGCKNADGYGRFSASGRAVRAHRVAFFLTTGSLPPSGFGLCHHCDNPACVSVEHLFIGTQHDNMIDCARKGRHLSPTTKLTPQLVTEARRRYAEGGTNYTRLALHYGVRACTMRKAIVGVSWRNVPSP